MHTPRIAVIGAGVAGLAAAIDLASAGCEVRVFERGATPGGKMRQVTAGGVAMDAGPTVFTMRRVFDELFADAGDDFQARVTLVPARILARHAWGSTSRLDLFADITESADAIGRLAGSTEAQGFRRFAERACKIYTALDEPFMRGTRPSLGELVRRVGVTRVADLWNLQPFTSLWQSTGRYFKDARLRQLFSRYATYCGSSPFDSPATLMLVAHAEQSGVWYVNGGMYQLAVRLAELAERKGALLTYGTEVARIHLEHGRVSAVQTSLGERIVVDAVVSNADNNALAAGLFGAPVRDAAPRTAPAARSLSAVTWNLTARTAGFELAHHSVFFSDDYRAEFDDIFRHSRLPRFPTVYVCAQDRCDGGVIGAAERLLCLVNAPPIGDRHVFEAEEIDACERQVFSGLAACGLTVQRRPGQSVVTTPTDFNGLFPGTGGALYGPASHGWMASFKRAGSRSRIPGLYLAGGSTHPGPGVPMAAMSGRLAAASIMTDYALIVPSRRMATVGGTSMR